MPEEHIWNVDSLKEHFDEKIQSVREHVGDNDLRYKEKFDAQNTAVTKAETAQSSYNTGHNDLIKKMEAMVTVNEFVAEKNNNEKWRERMELDIRILRESKSGIEGKNSNLDQMAADVKTLLLARSGSVGETSGQDNTWKIIFAVIGAIGVIAMIANLIVNALKK